MAVLSKTVEHLTQTMHSGFSELRQDMRNLNTAVQRQMWALIAVVAGGVIKILCFS